MQGRLRGQEWRARRAVACLVACASLAIAGFGATAQASGGWYDWPGMKKCDEFRAGDTLIKAYASKETESQAPLGCGRANRIMRAWWRGPDPEAHDHQNGDYYTLERFPGWRCSSGSGGGSCSRGDRVAGYQNKIA